MRSKIKPPVERQLGERRVREAFLWFPKTLSIGGDGRQTRWLERGVWIEKFVHIETFLDDYYMWIPLNWVKDDEL